MAAAPAPQMQVRERRFAEPVERFLRAKIEPVHQPLYSTLAHAAAAIVAETTWFQYAVGQAPSGAGWAAGTVSSNIHTNMQIASQLPQPRLHLIEGVRLYVPNVLVNFGEIAQETDDDGAATAQLAFLNDLRRLVWGTQFHFFIGSKPYFDMPTFLLPANAGLHGLGSTAIANGTAEVGGGPIQWRAISHYGQKGKPFRMNTYPILLYPMQPFFAAMRRQQAAGPVLAAVRMVTCSLDGLNGREVQ